MSTRLLTPSIQNNLAKTFASHHVPGNPIVLSNVYDIPTAQAVISLVPKVKAIATSSYAFAAVQGVADDELSLEGNIEQGRRLANFLARSEKRLPLTVDLRDGYGERLTEAVTKAIELGASGCNIEDTYVNSKTKEWMLYPIDTQVERLKQVREVAESLGVPDFVINARTDSVVPGVAGLSSPDVITEAIKRGQTYLATGVPTTVFVWGGSRGLSKDEVVRLKDAYGGKLNVLLTPGGLSVKELGEIGVARISIGAKCITLVTDVIGETAKRILEGGGL